MTDPTATDPIQPDPDPGDSTIDLVDEDDLDDDADWPEWAEPVG